MPSARCNATSGLARVAMFELVDSPREDFNCEGLPDLATGKRKSPHRSIRRDEAGSFPAAFARL
jgi:hypothetical protein